MPQDRVANARRAGSAAFMKGETLSSNPYLAPASAEAWISGWNEAWQAAQPNSGLYPFYDVHRQPLKVGQRVEYRECYTPMNYRSGFGVVQRFDQYGNVYIVADTAQPTYVRGFCTGSSRSVCIATEFDHTLKGRVCCIQTHHDGFELDRIFIKVISDPSAIQASDMPAASNNV